jgi:hypothetical protein
MVKKLATIGILFCVLLTSSSFISESPTVNKKGTFTYFINGKPFVIEGITGSYRKITGGEYQLSFSNDRFVKFTFMNPVQESKIDLTQQSRAAFIRYEDPSTSLIGKPAGGFVKIDKIDENNKVVSGTFEMNLRVILNDGSIKNINISEGRLNDIPIVFKQ